MKPVCALVLAGGMGTRLQSVVQSVPKPMADVLGEPFLAHQMRYWHAQGVGQFVISTGYLGHIIHDYFGRSWNGIPVHYVHETTPLGTGGAIQLAFNTLPFELQPDIILNGDTWLTASLEQLWNPTNSCTGDALVMAVKPLAFNDRYGVVQLNDQQRVIGFSNDKINHCYINTGCYRVFAPQLKAHLKAQNPPFSFEAKLLPDLAVRGKISAIIQDTSFLDIGIPDDYAKSSNFVCPS